MKKLIMTAVALMLMVNSYAFGMADKSDHSQTSSTKDNKTLGWVDSGRSQCKEEGLIDNDNKKCDLGCVTGACSPDGKWCADVAKFKFELTDPNLRFKYLETTPENCAALVRVTAGPDGWWDLSYCLLSNNQGTFEIHVRGWTRPQTFKVCVPYEVNETKGSKFMDDKKTSKPAAVRDKE